MGSSAGVGFMAVFAVSGSVVLVALQLHKRLLSDFMKKVESEFQGTIKYHRPQKKVRFADDVQEPSSNNKEYRKRYSRTIMPANGTTTHPDKDQDHTMPLNRQTLYKGIIESRTLNRKTVPNCS